MLFALYVGIKAAHRARLRRLYHAVRISPAELVALRAQAPELVLVDARSALARQADPRRFPNAVTFQGEDVAKFLPSSLRERIIVTFCTCPNEASAAWLADELLRIGFERVRVLTGGEDALQALAQVD